MDDRDFSNLSKLSPSQRNYLSTYDSVQDDKIQVRETALSLDNKETSPEERKTTSQRPFTKFTRARGLSKHLQPKSMEYISIHDALTLCLRNLKYDREKDIYTQKVDASGENLEETVQSTAEKILQEMISDNSFSEAIFNIWNECDQPLTRKAILDRFIRSDSPLPTDCAVFLLAVTGLRAEYLLSGELI